MAPKKKNQSKSKPKKKPVKKKPAKKKQASGKKAKKRPAASNKAKKVKPAKKKSASDKLSTGKSKKKKSAPASMPKRKKTRQLSQREQKIYKILLKRRERLMEELKAKLAIELHDESLHDEGDLATRDTASDFLMAIATIEGEEIKNIDDALNAIKGGYYGKCEICESKISSERLKALPSVKLCIKCKELEEQGKLE